jgi:hypothetical protein
MICYRAPLLVRRTPAPLLLVFFTKHRLSRLKTGACEDNFRYAEGGTSGYPRYDHRSLTEYDVSGDVA